MRKQTENLLISGSFLLVVLALIVFVARAPQRALDVGIEIGGWIFFILQALYHRWESLALLFQRAIFFITNPETYWNFSSEFRLKADRESTLKLVCDVIEYYFPDPNIKIDLLSRSFMRIFAQGRIFEATWQEDSEGLGVLFLRTHDMPVTFRSSLSILEDQLSPMLSRIEAALNPEEKRYYLGVEFKGRNPYYGLFVKRLAPKDVDSFTVTIKVNASSVKIDKERLVVSALTVPDLRRQASDYLVLSARGLPQ